MTTMLEIRNLGVRYGHHLALEGVSAKVEKGEICVILGANGAGKSSLLKAIAGMVKAEAGSEIVMNGKPITGMKPHRIVEEGIALVPGGPRHLRRPDGGGESAARRLRAARPQPGSRHAQADIRAVPAARRAQGQVVRTMSGGEQQMVAIGRALMSKPEILMLDEPSLGLSPLLTKDLFKSLKAIAATGVGILLVEQNAKQSLKIADRGYLIENGLITGENTAAALAEDPAVVNAYLGGATETKKTASRKIRLPAPFALPSTLEAMGRFMGELASRASAIQAAFIRFVRREAPVPSAFVGRHDPQTRRRSLRRDRGGAQHIPTERSRPMVSSDARNLSTDAGRLAHAAAERLARHVRTQQAFRRRDRAPSPICGKAGGERTPTPPNSPAARPSASPGMSGRNARRAGHATRAPTAGRGEGRPRRRARHRP
jgi:branched-chain amino acid transport system ATP-binding protein